MWQSVIQGFRDVLTFLYGVTESIGFPSYGLAIVFITVIMKLVLWPLNQKQMKSMKGMQKLQPKIKMLQERYKDNPQVLQAKMGELYKENGVSPFSGCLPVIVQMPIFIAFYQGLYNFPFPEGAIANFLWIPDISKPDPFYIIVALVVGTTFLQQRITMVNITDKNQKMMLYVMPLVMGWITFRLPAGLPLYWTVLNTCGILQQL
ncbi:MAG: YidC/Oxa1 family membrane protein insertase, partial [Syntrophomonadaceae bacterium]|nr:YidC/Oxa1 family membrane protein insertase [Syntrophomonadaceae bacterium]